MGFGKLITRADLPNTKDITRSIYLSSGQVNVTTSATETLIRQVPIPANTFKRQQHLKLLAGGIGLANANITAFQIFGRFGKDGLVSPLFTFNASYNPAITLVHWYLDYTLTRDVGSPDQISIAGFFLLFDPASGTLKGQHVARGEIAADFTIDNNLYLSGLITSAANPVLATETFELVKHSMLTDVV